MMAGSPRNSNGELSQKPMRVVIIGGSIAGLMQGIMLKRLGHDVKILERNTSSERLEGGTGITMGSTGPESLEFFRRFNLVKKPFSVHSPGLQFINTLSKVTRYMKRPMEMSTWSVLHYNLRSNFDGYKSKVYPDPPDPLSGDGKADFSLGKKVIDMKYTDGQVQVLYEDLVKGGQHSLAADLVVVADGASSQIRQRLIPNVQREYSGYLAWRGFVDESEVSEETRKLFGPNLTSFPCKGGYILSYIIPGKDGNLEPGHRRINWIWYYDCPAGSENYSEILTSKNGHLHRNYVPLGHVRPAVWERQLEIASAIFSPPILEMVTKSTNIAISVIHDYACPKAAFFDGKVVLVGDALALFRPHAAISFNQAALNCLLFERVMKGEIRIREWERKVTLYGARSRATNEILGAFLVYGVLAAMRGMLRYIRTFLPF